jgi:hypothetical protein
MRTVITRLDLKMTMLSNNAAQKYPRTNAQRVKKTREATLKEKVAVIQKRVDFWYIKPVY